jgi:transcriptional regulator GlxA family with amidase domain
MSLMFLMIDDAELEMAQCLFSELRLANKAAAANFTREWNALSEKKAAIQATQEGELLVLELTQEAIDLLVRNKAVEVPEIGTHS